jgi:hypothetical protein
MSLPLLLAGPILRRVEPTLVSVWVALRDHCDVRLKVWEGRAESRRPTPLAQSPVTPTLRVGAQLHLAEVTVQLPDTAGVSFQADSLYSYDLAITDASDTVHTLETLHMLEEGFFDGHARLPLGFEPGLLPSFAPPPSELTNLNLLYGSCRLPGHPTPDALAMVDDLIFGDDRYKDPRARPHQLFLGGDQIYADDVTRMHMLVVEEAAVPLIGTTGDQEFPDPIEHLPLDQVLRREDEAKAKDPTPLDGYADEDPAVTAADPLIPADRIHFPEGRRLQLTLHDAQLTSKDGSSHILSLGEFAALYISVWSPAIWGTEVVGAKFAPDSTAPAQAQPFRWDQELPPFVKGKREEGAIVLPSINFPKRVAGHLYVVPREKPQPPKSDAEKAKDEFEKQKSLRQEFAILQEFHRNLPKVQRALANVPTYMVLDDHDITDDFFLNPVWRTRVLGRKLGQAILGNGMIAYALFQDWGNDPVTYESGPKAQLLTLVQKLFPPDLKKGPDQQVFQQIAALLGHSEPLTQTPDGKFLSANPALKWHFTIDGPKHRAIVFDNRTRRSYASQAGPPGNVSVDAMVDQLPLPPLPADREILIVIAPLPVIGPPVLDEIVAPLSYRVFDAVQAKSTASLLDPSSTSGLRQMTGTNPDAIEAWAFDAETFEQLLKRLEPYGRVVLLSGDVHYSSGTVMSYWKGNATRPARFAQFISSGFKNVMPTFITFLDRAAGFAQQLIRLNLGTERLGWDQPLDDLVLFPEGANEFDLLPVMRSRLGSVPVRVPTWGWPDHNDPERPETFDPLKTSRLNPAKPPDWRWRVKPLLDQRSEVERPEPIRLLALDADVEAKLSDPTTILEGYQQVAARHQHALERLRNARQILFRGNVGRVRFEAQEDGRLDAIHEIYTAFSDPDEPVPVTPKVEPYLVQVASLGPEDEEPPTRLRQKAIEIPPAGRS